ncbi:MAG: hypothetical protein HYZ17_14150 [Betaproteobacteria bacterium]|nr:hypothetical protein [Betaproteobacteria bacterium]
MFRSKPCLLASLLAFSMLVSPVLAQTASEAVAAAPMPAPKPEFKLSVVNPEDLLDFGKTVVVPTAYVTLLTDGRVAAVKQSGFFQRGSNSVGASASYRVQGIDKAFAQALAQAAYEDLVTQLRQAGYKVLTYADIRERDLVKTAARQTELGPLGLPTSSQGGNQFVTAAPSDEQHFASSFAGGAFAEFISLGKSKFADATVIIPQYTFAAPQSWAAGSRGYNSVSAEANVAPGMNLSFAHAHWLGAPKSRMMSGIPGVATKEQIINITEKAGTLEKTADTTPQAANAVSSLLGAISGAGTIKKTAGEYQLSIDRDAYTAGVMNGVRGFNAEVAKIAAAL